MLLLAAAAGAPAAPLPRASDSADAGAAGDVDTLPSLGASSEMAAAVCDNTLEASLAAELPALPATGVVTGSGAPQLIALPNDDAMVVDLSPNLL